VIAGEAFEMYSRNILDCIKSLFSDPEFTSQLILSPERHYADADKTQRLYHEMNTGKWWWSTQVSPIIFLYGYCIDILYRKLWIKENQDPQ
jgi:hypothetical protein